MYPILGHVRFLLEFIRPEIRQYFIESNTEARRSTGRPATWSTSGPRASRPTSRSAPSATSNAIGYEFLRHSHAGPVRRRPADPRVRVGGPDCTQPYDIALLNVSAMSFGSLSGNAIQALNGGAARGGFAHDTGEGGISPYHLRARRRPDLGDRLRLLRLPRRTTDASTRTAFAEKAAHAAGEGDLDQAVAGRQAGPGRGAARREGQRRRSPRRAASRSGQTVVSPPAHSAFSTPLELVRVHRARCASCPAASRSGSSCASAPASEFLGDLQGDAGDAASRPDFIIVDGAEGGTGAAPLEFEDHVGMPLTEGLMLVHNALVGTGLRDRVKIGASGKVASGGRHRQARSARAPTSPWRRGR